MYNKTAKVARTNNSNATTKQNRQDDVLNRFADMMIAKIESISLDWKKPWFTTGTMSWPKNISGRCYNGMNSLMLMLHCEEEGYKYPLFVTFEKVNSMNFSDTTSGKKPAVDKNGNKLPMVSVNKGEKSFPVFITTFTVVDKNDNKIKYEEYRNLSEEEQKKYTVFPKLTRFLVFNIAQTNIEEARPELFKKITQEYNVTTETATDENMFSFEPMDRMITDNLWICPIKPTYGDNAYYSISKKEIVIPEKKQFINGESFYGNLFHEMAHSTGAEDQLNRLKPSTFGSDDYAREELVAELTAALVASYYGMDKNIKEDSAAYLKGWLKSLKEDTSYIKTVLLDVKRASALINQKIDNIIGKADE